MRSTEKRRTLEEKVALYRELLTHHLSAAERVVIEALLAKAEDKLRQAAPERRDH